MVGDGNLKYLNPYRFLESNVLTAFWSGSFWAKWFEFFLVMDLPQQV